MVCFLSSKVSGCLRQSKENPAGHDIPALGQEEPKVEAS